MIRRRRSWSFSVRILSSALSEARNLADAALPGETGGILLGYRDERGVEARRFLEVPDEDAGPASYRRRHSVAQERLDAALAKEPPGSHLGYVGEWHSHPQRRGASLQDIHELRECAHQVKNQIALIVLSLHGRSWTALAWAGRRRQCQPLDTVEIVQDGELEAE